MLDGPVLTGDQEFQVAEELGVTVRWLGRPAECPSTRPYFPAAGLSAGSQRRQAAVRHDRTAGQTHGRTDAWPHGRKERPDSRQ